MNKYFKIFIENKWENIDIKNIKKDSIIRTSDFPNEVYKTVSDSYYVNDTTGYGMEVELFENLEIKC